MYILTHPPHSYMESLHLLCWDSYIVHLGISRKGVQKLRRLVYMRIVRTLVLLGEGEGSNGGDLEFRGEQEEDRERHKEERPRHAWGRAWQRQRSNTGSAGGLEHLIPPILSYQRAIDTSVIFSRLAWYSCVLFGCNTMFRLDPKLP